MSNLVNLRNRDFLRCCMAQRSRLAEQGVRPTRLQVVLRVLAEPAPGYYVDFYRANRILVPAYAAGARRLDHKYNAGRVWNDMLHDLRALRLQHPHTPLRQLILMLCAGGAGTPRFYISPSRALAIYSLHPDSLECA